MTGIGQHARADPGRTAIVAMGREITYGELDERQRRVAGALDVAGLAARDRVGVLSSNRPELLEVTIGALRAGIVPIPINPLVTPREVAYILEDSGTRWLFTDRSGVPVAGATRTVTFGDAYERLLFEADPAPSAAVALGRPMHYTSGTTGLPKGVWVDPVDEERASLRAQDFQTFWTLASDDRHLVCSPLSHSAPHRYAMRTLDAGGVVVLLSRFVAEEVVAAVDLFGITTTFMVPTHLERILELSERTLRRHELSSLRLLVHAGAPIRETTKRAVIDLLPHGAVWEFYGATEGQATRISPAEWLEKPGSVGTPRPGAEITIRSDEHEPLAAGTGGEIWISDPTIERFEYWGDGAKTRAAWRGTALTLGDVGYLDDDGYLFLTGRKHDTIITGGVNVYPEEVETVLAEHPAVAEVMVFGVSNPEWGQEVWARVVPAFAQPLDVEVLRSWARERLAAFKCPRHIEIVQELPRTPTGKLKRGI